MFQKSLTGPTLKWFTLLDMATIRTWNDVSQAFLGQYSFNLDLVPKRADLIVTKQNPSEPFGEYVGCWRTLASQVQDGPSDEESLEIVIGGAQPTTRALLSIQPITTFAALIRAGTRVESSLRSGNFPAFSVFAKQATVSSTSTSSSTSNNSSSSTNSCPKKKDSPKTGVAYADPPLVPVLLSVRPPPNQVVYAPTPRAPPHHKSLPSPNRCILSHRSGKRSPKGQGDISESGVNSPHWWNRYMSSSPRSRHC